MGTIVKRQGKRGTSYLARIRIKRGGVIIHEESKTFSKQADAKIWVSRREAQLAEPGAMDAANKVTVGELIDKYTKEYGGADWGLTKKSDLMKLKKTALAEIPAYQLTSRDLIEHVRLRRQAGTGPSTVNNDLVWLRVVFKTARPAWGYDLNPQVIDDAAVHCRQQRLISRPNQRSRRPTIEELNALLDYFSRGDGRATIPMAEIILFQMFSGRRDGETCRIRWDDVQGHTLLVRDMKHPAHKTDERVALTEEAYLIIQRQPHQEGEQRIFPYNERSVSAAFRRGCRFCGIEDLHLHDLRHECASWLADLGWQIPKIAKVTGHRSWNALKRYTHVDGTEIKDKYEAWAWRPVRPQQLAVHQSNLPDQ